MVRSNRSLESLLRLDLEPVELEPLSLEVSSSTATARMVLAPSWLVASTMAMLMDSVPASRPALVSARGLMDRPRPPLSLEEVFRLPRLLVSTFTDPTLASPSEPSPPSLEEPLDSPAGPMDPLTTTPSINSSLEEDKVALHPKIIHSE